MDRCSPLYDRVSIKENILNGPRQALNNIRDYDISIFIVIISRSTVAGGGLHLLYLNL